MKRVVLVAMVVAACVIGLPIAGCKQGEGERCQVNDDCTPPLICSTAKLTCQNTTTGDLDAAVTPDAPPPDAAVDAPPDAFGDARDGGN